MKITRENELHRNVRPEAQRDCEKQNLRFAINHGCSSEKVEQQPIGGFPAPYPKRYAASARPPPRAATAAASGPAATGPWSTRNGTGRPRSRRTLHEPGFGEARIAAALADDDVIVDRDVQQSAGGDQLIRHRVVIG